MTAISKMPRAPRPEEEDTDIDDLFDFGEPEIYAVEISPGKFLSLREPSAADLKEIGRFSNQKDADDIDVTLQTICILHYAKPGEPRLTMKTARRLRARQLRELSKGIDHLLGGKGEDEKSEEPEVDE